MKNLSHNKNSFNGKIKQNNHDFWKVLRLKNKKTGFTLIEVLIAMSLLSFILLSLIDWQLTSLRHSQQALLQTIAIQQLIDVAEKYQINKNTDLDSAISKTLPNASLTKISKANFYLLRLTWSSNEHYFWHCSITKEKKLGCLEMRVAK